MIKSKSAKLVCSCAERFIETKAINDWGSRSEATVLARWWLALLSERPLFQGIAP